MITATLKTVLCGGGVNIYFYNLGWDSERVLSTKADVLVTHLRISESLALTGRNKAWNDRRIRECRNELAFHMLRSLSRNAPQARHELKRLFRMAPRVVALLPLDMIRVGIGRFRSFP